MVEVVKTMRSTSIRAPAGAPVPQILPLESNSSAATAKKLDGLGDNDLYCADQLVPRVFRQ